MLAMRLLKWVLLNLMLLFAFGCAVAPPIPVITKDAAIEVINSDADRATLVIIQPRNLRYDTRPKAPTNIVDVEGRLLGQVSPHKKTVILIPPGEIRLYALSNSLVDRLEGGVRAGKVYYATIGNLFGGISFLTLNPRSLDNRWANLESYLSKNTLVKVEPARIEEVLSSLGDTSARLKSADDRWEKYDVPHIEERTIRPEDGLSM